MTARLGSRKRRLLKIALRERDGDECTWCCKPMIDAPILPGEDCSAHMTLEHILPASLGGSNDIANLALACFSCNNARGPAIDFQPLPSEHDQAVVDETH